MNYIQSCSIISEPRIPQVAASRRFHDQPQVRVRTVMRARQRSATTGVKAPPVVSVLIDKYIREPAAIIVHQTVLGKLEEYITGHREQLWYRTSNNTPEHRRGGLLLLSSKPCSATLSSPDFSPSCIALGKKSSSRSAPTLSLLNGCRSRRPTSLKSTA